MASKEKNAVGEATVGGKKQEYTSEISTLSAEDENLVPTSSEGAEIAETSNEGTPKTLLAASYSPKTWIEGEVIYDDDLNHAEQGIKNNSDDIASLSADLTDMKGKTFTTLEEMDTFISDEGLAQGQGMFFRVANSSFLTNGDSTSSGKGFFIVNTTSIRETDFFLMVGTGTNAYCGRFSRGELTNVSKYAPSTSVLSLRQDDDIEV